MASCSACGNLHIANLHRLHGDAPRRGLLVENALQFAGPASRARPPSGAARAARSIRAAPVCALSMMACVKSCTSRIDFSAFHTIQNTMASTFTGTVSRVSVDSADTLATRTRWSTIPAQPVDDRDHVEQPRPAQPDDSARSAAPPPSPTGPQCGWRTGSTAHQRPRDQRRAASAAAAITAPPAASETTSNATPTLLNRI